MLIVISHSIPFAGEAMLITQLFDAGMALLHLRKPDVPAEEYRKLLGDIPLEHRDKIVLHQHHHLGEAYGIGRLHFPATQRMNTRSVHYSTSVHSIAEYRELPVFFEYAFLSPVFDSISKPGYKAGLYDMASLGDKRCIRLIGLGGVTAENCGQVYAKGFDGVAVLGAIWEASHPLEEFMKIKEKCSIHVR